MCGFCGLPMHTSEHGYTRCVKRSMRLADSLGTPWDETKIQDGDESPDWQRSVGFPYRRGAVQAEA